MDGKSNGNTDNLYNRVTLCIIEGRRRDMNIAALYTAWIGTMLVVIVIWEAWEHRRNIAGVILALWMVMPWKQNKRRKGV